MKSLSRRIPAAVGIVFITSMMMLFALPCLASMIWIDGSASVRIVLVTESNVICSSTASGDRQESLFALDARNGNVLWRFSTPRIFKGTLASSGTFLLITKDFLESRSLATGKVNWSTRLDAIPQQITKPRLKLKDRVAELVQKALGNGPATITVATGLGGTPNSYRYSEPILTGARILISREAVNHSGGCVVMGCFKDWLLFDTRTGSFVRGGSGDILGRAGISTLVGSDAGVFRIAKGSADAVTLPSTASRAYWSVRSDRFPTGQLSCNDACAFEIGWSGESELIRYDGHTGRMRAMSIPTTRNNYQSGWVLLEEYILRYSECSRFDVKREQSDCVWFELYDWEGKCVRSAETPQVGTNAYLSWVSFVGRTNDTVHFQSGERNLSVAVPSLAITTHTQPRTGGNYYYNDPQSFSPSRGVFYESRGNTNITKMPTNVMPHELTVTARRSATGQILWKHSDRVLIQRNK
jgi:hypothetical protein